MFWLVEVALYIGATLLVSQLTPRPAGGTSRPPRTTLDQFGIPTTDQGGPVPYVCGTVPLDAPAVLWDGDYATVPIVVDGQTVGYQYLIGMQLGLCLGEIDELVEVRWDRKTLPGAPIAVSPDNDALAMRDVLERVVRIPQGFYADPQALCLASGAAMDQTFGYAASHYRVVWGHRVVAGWNDRLLYAVQVDGAWREMDIRIPAGDYGKVSGLNWPGPPEDTYEICNAVLDAIEAAEAVYGDHLRVTECTIDNVTNLFSLHVAALNAHVTGFRLYGAPGAELINPCLGIHHNSSVEFETLVLPATLEGTFPTQPQRYLFGGGATGSSILMTRSETTARSLFGATGTLDYPATGALAERTVQFVDDAVTYTPMTGKTRVVINSPSQFGAGDGVSGTIDVYHGGDDQVVDEYLASAGAIGSPLPPYPGLVHAALHKCYVGNTGQFRPVSFVVRRCPDPLGLGEAIANLAGDANGAEVIYDLLTSPLVQQRPAAPSSIERSDFEYAARVLFEEGLGVSLVLGATATLGEHIDRILQHIDGVRYTDPETGRIRLKLIRNDYQIADLVRLDAGNIVSCKHRPRCWPDTKNVVKVAYTDRTAGYARRVVQARDLANLQIQDGEAIVEEIEFEGFSNATRAQWAADRTLQTLSYPGKPVDIVANRVASVLRPGDPFVHDWPALGIHDLVCRVNPGIGYGAPGSSQVRFEALEDIWGSPLATYDGASIARWENPVAPPSPLSAQRLEEAPYVLAAGERRRILALGARGAGEGHGFRAFSDPAGGTAYVESNPSAQFTPSGVLNGLMGYDTDQLALASVTDLSRLLSITTQQQAAGWNLCLVDDEWMAWRTVELLSDGQVLVAELVRGVLDSTPAMHYAGARVWFPSAAAPGLDGVDHDADLEVAAVLRPTNLAGTLEPDLATPVSLETVSRAWRPYAPTALRLNGESYPEELTGDLVLAWSHRNRLAPWSYADAGVTDTLEPGITYTVRIYDADGLLVHEATGITAAGYTYVREPGAPVMGTGWRVVVQAVRSGIGGWGEDWGNDWGQSSDTIESLQAIDYTFGTDRGFGLDWGHNWGGAAA